jgi:mannitol/fructose-specific phosphotransferase system IIA component (Ntr-type)
MPKASAVGPAVREFLSCFSSELFLPHLLSRTKQDALAEMVDMLVVSSRVRSRELLLEMLERRESLGSTGIGKGVALPHGRSLAVRELVGVVGRSVKGIDYDAIDGKPVHLLFLVVAPPQDTDSQYLTVLGRLVEIVKNTARRRQLLKATSFDDFLACVEAHRFDE